MEVRYIVDINSGSANLFGMVDVCTIVLNQGLNYIDVQTVTDSGITLVVLNHVDMQEATTILAKDLKIDDEIMSGSEGWIESCKWGRELKFDKTQALLVKGWWLRLAMLLLSSSTAPGTSNSLIDTLMGRIPWANTEIKVVGVENDNFAQMHKGSLGRVMDVVKNLSMKSGIGILPGYIPTHSPAEIRHVYGHPKRIMQIQNEKKLEDEERAKDAAHEQLAIPSFGNQLENATFTQGGAPLTLRAGTPPPWTDWIDDPEITKVLPRGKVFVALRGQDDDLEVVISSQDGLNEAVYLAKPKARAPIKTINTTQHLDPSKCSHTAANSYSSKLFLEKGKKIKTRRFQEIPVDGPLLRVLQLVCAHVPMMPDEDKAGKGAIAITQLQDILEKQLLGMQITDKERALLGE
ncbi:hypothetical protein BT96DRAFT_946750 [Gymnopus androsaceus JB14]|uniref:Uncharacterized protein n=1 Tax=Gymnopus androsaceus JB14 TaxID=1447944 RepID=A0A6A4GW77_9AGAR|nr:hypothetical protein BT96DRAFT_946750 [Gymnopus androsaceus JB14]